MSLRGFERTEFPRKVKAAAFKRCCKADLPHCENCGIVLTAGNIVFEHVTPDGLGGEPTLENCKVFCRKVCASRKTFGQDNPRMQKADRSLKKAYGIATRKGRPMFGSRASGFKRKMDGTVVRR